MFNMKTINTIINEDNELEVESEYEDSGDEFIPGSSDSSSDSSSDDCYVNIVVKENKTKRKRKRDTGPSTPESDDPREKRCRLNEAAAVPLRSCVVSLTPLPDVSISVSGSSVSGSLVSGPSVSGPSVSGPSVSGPSVSGASVSGSSVSGPSVSGPSVSGPSVSGPSVSGPSFSEPAVNGTKDDRKNKEAAQPASKVEKKKTLCPVCKLPFSGGIARHMRNKHPNDYEALGGRSWRQAEAESHRRGSQTKARKKKQCQVCRNFVVNITRHMRDIHKDEDLSQEMKKKPEDALDKEPEILKQFFEYAISSSGGNKPKSVVRQYLQQIKRCLIDLSPTFDLEEIFRRGTTDEDQPHSRIYATVVKDLEQKVKEGHMAPTTAQNHYYALGHFLDFLIDEKSITIADYAPQVEKMKSKCKKWSQSLKKEKAKRVNANQIKAKEKIPTTEVLSKFDHHPYVMEKYTTALKEEITREENGMEPDRDNYHQIRDVLIYAIIGGSAQRTGVVLNMRKEELHNARQMEHSLVIPIADHKTKSAGSATPAIGNFYVEGIKWLARTSKHETNLFSTYNGNKLESNHVNTAITKVLNAIGHTGRVTATLMRKSAAIVMKNAPEFARKELAGQMSHQFATHNRSYALTDLEERCERADRVRSTLSIVRGHKSLPAALGAPTPIENTITEQMTTPIIEEMNETGDKEEEEECLVLPEDISDEINSLNSEPPLDSVPEQSLETALEQDPEPSTETAPEPSTETAPDSTLDTDTNERHRRRAGFTEEDNAILRKIFRRGNVPTKEMRRHLLENEDMRLLQARAKERLGKEFTVKQLIDKVRVLKDN